MKLLNRLQHFFAAGFAGAALVSSAAADVIPVKPENGSKHFDAVAKHLELGGLFFTYMDVDGDLASMGELGDRLLGIVRKSTPAIPREMSAAKMIDALGFNCVKAVGMSSRKLDKDLFHNRALVYMPEGPKGLMKLFGGKAAPFPLTSFAPADAGMAYQVEITLGALLETAEAVIKSMGQGDLLAQYKAVLSFPVPGTTMSAGEFIGKLNTRIMVVLRIDEGKKLSVPGAPVEIPGIQLMIAFEDIDFVMQPLLAMMGENDAVTVEKGEGFTIMTPNSPMPGDLTYFKPALYHDQKSKRIILTSHLEMAKSAGKGDTLAGNAEFKKATAGLPTEGNGLSYTTPQCMKAFVNFYSNMMEQSMKAGGVDGPPREMMDIILSMFPTPSAPVASIYANVPEGMLFASNTDDNHKQTLMQVAAVPLAVLVAGATTAYSTTMEKARARVEERARPVQPREDGDEAPAKAVKNNLQQIAFSAQTYFIDNPKAKEVTYEALVKAELIFDLDPVAGEAYKGLTLKRGGGELSVKLKGGDSISLKYQATKD